MSFNGTSTNMCLRRFPRRDAGSRTATACVRACVYNLKLATVQIKFAFAVDHHVIRLHCGRHTGSYKAGYPPIRGLEAAAVGDEWRQEATNDDGMSPAGLLTVRPARPPFERAHKFLKRRKAKFPAPCQLQPGYHGIFSHCLHRRYPTYRVLCIALSVFDPVGQRRFHDRSGSPSGRPRPARRQWISGFNNIGYVSLRVVVHWLGLT